MWERKKKFSADIPQNMPKIMLAQSIKTYIPADTYFNFVMQ